MGQKGGIIIIIVIIVIIIVLEGAPRYLEMLHHVDWNRKQAGVIEPAMQCSG